MLVLIKYEEHIYGQWCIVYPPMIISPPLCTRGDRQQSSLYIPFDTRWEYLAVRVWVLPCCLKEMLVQKIRGCDLRDVIYVQETLSCISYHILRRRKGDTSTSVRINT